MQKLLSTTVVGCYTHRVLYFQNIQKTDGFTRFVIAYAGERNLELRCESFTPAVCLVDRPSLAYLNRNFYL